MDNEILKFVGQAAVVIIGWIVVNKLSIKRETDKARKDILIKSIDALCDSVDKLFEVSRDYHSKTERDLQAEIKIKMSIQDFGLRVASLKDLTGLIPVYIACEDDTRYLRQAITGTHFEDEHTSAQTADSTIFQKIAETTLAAKRHLIALKHSQFL